MKKVAISLRIQVELVQANSHKLKGILHTIGPARVALPIIDVIMEHTKILWQTRSSLTPTAKRTEERCKLPLSGMSTSIHTQLQNLWW